ncbi:MAG: ABC-2 transporter permease, partial [Roseburia sp.]|nr:ABC-2 transporter permease [Roseburia sp.]
MRGLLLKDFYLMAGQKRFFIIVFAIAVLFFLTGQNEEFIVGYVTMLCGIFAVTTIHYDEFNKGNIFLFTLPFQRKQYAVEKYLFGIIAGGAAWIASFAVVMVLGYGRGELDIREWGVPMLTYFLVLLLMLAVMIPIELKFGAEKGKLATFVLFFAVFGIFFLVTNASEEAGIDLSALAGQMNLAKLAVGAVLVTLLILAVSVSAS